MIVICSHCNTTLGEKPPYSNKATTHGICSSCLPEYLREADIPEDEIAELVEKQRGREEKLTTRTERTRMSCTDLREEYDAGRLSRSDFVRKLAEIEDLIDDKQEGIDFTKERLCIKSH